MKGSIVQFTLVHHHNANPSRYSVTHGTEGERALTYTLFHCSKCDSVSGPQ